MRDIDMNFLSPPEMTLSGCPVSIPVERAVALFDQNLVDTDNVNLLEPKNTFVLMDLFDAGNFNEITNVFGLDE
jgi:hypothetical protein